MRRFRNTHSTPAHSGPSYLRRLLSLLFSSVFPDSSCRLSVTKAKKRERLDSHRLFNLCLELERQHQSKRTLAPLLGPLIHRLRSCLPPPPPCPVNRHHLLITPPISIIPCINSRACPHHLLQNSQGQRITQPVSQLAQRIQSTKQSTEN